MSYRDPSEDPPRISAGPVKTFTKPVVAVFFRYRTFFVLLLLHGLFIGGYGLYGFLAPHFSPWFCGDLMRLDPAGRATFRWWPPAVGCQEPDLMGGFVAETTYFRPLSIVALFVGEAILILITVFVMVRKILTRNKPGNHPLVPHSPESTPCKYRYGAAILEQQERWPASTGHKVGALLVNLIFMLALYMWFCLLIFFPVAFGSDLLDPLPDTEPMFSELFAFICVCLFFWTFFVINRLVKKLFGVGIGNTLICGGYVIFGENNETGIKSRIMNNQPIIIFWVLFTLFVAPFVAFLFWVVAVLFWA